MSSRKSGILLHITSLPGKDGIGTLGKEAYEFVDLLKETGQKLWQILPLGPVGAGDSPYQCFSAFAGNPAIIDLQKMVEDGFLNEKDIQDIPNFSSQKVQFKKVKKWKFPLFRKAFEQFKNEVHGKYFNEYNHFLDEHAWWLNDYALFMSAKDHFGKKSWHEWEEGFKRRESDALQKIGEELASEVDFHKFQQFLFFRQWFSLKNYANEKGIDILGDLPLYVSGESSDVWANTDIFLLDDNLEPVEVGGVPPDYFSETGQLWGNPVFNWERLKERDFDWWMARLHFNLHMFNDVRIDHFRGLESYWSVPAKEKTAINGKWVPAYGYEMLSLIKSQIGKLPFIAEDLGIITPEVDKLRKNFNLPGMKVLQFAFTDDSDNKDLPHNYSKNYVVYTGTHDNNTTKGWLKSAKGDEKKNIARYFGTKRENQLQNAINLAWSSVARWAIVPMQDLMELDDKSRMNTPGTAEGNWAWRFSWNQLEGNQKEFLKELTQRYNR